MKKSEFISKEHHLFTKKMAGDAPCETMGINFLKTLFAAKEEGKIKHTRLLAGTR